MNEHALSKRLETVAAFLPDQALFADIGSDHAYLPCFVCLKDQKARAIAGEVNEGPYLSAQKNVREKGLTDRIDVRLGNGLAVIEQEEVEQVVIAGMGGSLIASILEEGKDRLTGVNRIIAQPNVEARAVRRWFYKNGFSLVNERIIEEAGHIYEILVADKKETNTPYSEKQLLFGPFLLEEKSVPFLNKWNIEKEKREHALQQMKLAKQPDQVKIGQFERELQFIEEVLRNE